MPSVRNQGRKKCMKPEFTLSTIFLWVIPTSNWKIRPHRKPHFRSSRQVKNLSDTWWSSGSSSSLTNLKNNPSSIYAWRPGGYTTPYSTQMITRSIIWSGSWMHINSTRRSMGASYQGESNNMELRYCIHCMSLVLTQCLMVIIIRPRQQENWCSATSPTLRIQTNTCLLT